MSVGIQMGNTFGSYLISAVLSPVAVAANTSASQIFTIPGIKVGDLVFVNHPFPITAGTAITGTRVAGTNFLEIDFGNFTAGSLTPIAGIYNILIMRPEKNAAATVISD